MTPENERRSAFEAKNQFDLQKDNFIGHIESRLTQAVKSAEPFTIRR